MEKKTKTKIKVLSLLGAALILVIVTACITKCAVEERIEWERLHPPTYDVTVVVESTNGDMWLFTPDTKELSVEYEYTGEGLNFWVDGYHTCGEACEMDLDHPWFNDPYYPRSFSKTCLYYDPDGKQIPQKDEYHVIAKERGTYNYHWSANTGGNDFKYRSFILRVTIK